MGICGLYTCQSTWHTPLPPLGWTCTPASITPGCMQQSHSYAEHNRVSVSNGSKTYHGPTVRQNPTAPDPGWCLYSTTWPAHSQAQAYRPDQKNHVVYYEPHPPGRTYTLRATKFQQIWPWVPSSARRRKTQRTQHWWTWGALNAMTPPVTRDTEDFIYSLMRIEEGQPQRTRLQRPQN